MRVLELNRVFNRVTYVVFVGDHIWPAFKIAKLSADDAIKGWFQGMEAS